MLLVFILHLLGVPASTVVADNAATDEGTITVDLPSDEGGTATPPAYTLPEPGYKTVEVVFVVDAKFMEMYVLFISYKFVKGFFGNNFFIACYF